MSPSTNLVAVNLDKRSELARQIREIAEGAVHERRQLTPAEQDQIDALKADMQAAEDRARAFAEQQDRIIRLAPRSDRERSLLGIEGGSTSPVTGRGFGLLTGLSFSDADIRQLHDAHLERSSAQVEASAPHHSETRAVTAPPMATFGAQYLPVADFRREPTRIAGLMPAQRTDASTEKIYRGTTAASAAATVAEGAAKPESTPGWTGYDVPIRKLAHYVDVSTESLEDFPSFTQIVRDEMAAGLLHAENGQILNGNGSGTNLTGLLNVSGILTYAPQAAEKWITSILKGITALRNGASYAEADAVVLHPTDWQIVQTTATTDGTFIAHTSPLAAAPHTVWGVPVVLTTAIAAGTALVGCFKDAGVLFERKPATLMLDPYSQSKNNLVRIICEERIGLGATRPTALCKVTFNDGS